MAYQLKSTGIAANCTMCIAVDPDTGTIKDFASSAVTTDLLIGANVTISSQTWDGITRSYWKSGSGTTDADFVKFGTNKPQFQVNATVPNSSAVFIGEAAGAYARMFGVDSSTYIAAQSGASGGSTLPYAYIAAAAYTGNQTALTAGQKAIWGFSFRRSGTSDWFWANATDANMTTGNTAAIGAMTQTWTLSYVNRRNDSTAHQQDKVHAILIFNTALAQADWDSLRDDWFGTLLQSAGAAATSAPPRRAFSAPFVNIL